MLESGQPDWGGYDDEDASAYFRERLEKEKVTTVLLSYSLTSRLSKVDQLRRDTDRERVRRYVYFVLLFQPNISRAMSAQP